MYAYFLKSWEISVKLLKISREVSEIIPLYKREKLGFALNTNTSIVAHLKIEQTTN